MGMGGKYKRKRALGQAALTFVLGLLLLPAPALSSDRAHDPSTGADLRNAGNGPTFLPHPGLDMASSLPARRQDHQRRPGPPQRAAKLAPHLPQQGRALRRLDNTVVVKRWYAVASAGSGALAFVAGHASKAQGLYVQKRAQIRGGQLGLARNVGAAQVTIGYLHTSPDRDPLVPYYTGRARQNLAALSLTLRK